MMDKKQKKQKKEALLNPKVVPDEPLDVSPEVPADGVAEIHYMPDITTHKGTTTGREIVCGYDLTPMGNAKRFVAYFHDRVRYSDDLKAWFIWDSIKWARDHQLKVKALAKYVVTQIKAEALFVDFHGNEKLESEIRVAIEKHYKASSSNHNIKDMLELVKAESAIAITPEELDGNYHLLNFTNGTLDLREKLFREHRREDLLTKVTKVPYQPTTASKYFYRTLLFALEPDVAIYLQRVLGSMLEHTTQNKEILILYGAAFAAKSSISQAVYNSLGDYATSFPKELLEKGRSKGDEGKANPALMSLEGVRIAWTEETNEGMIFDESIFRGLTSSGVKSTRNLYERQRQLRLGASFIIETNSPPTIDTEDRNSRNAMLTRILVAPFVEPIPKENRDKTVLFKMTNDPNELMVALAWVVQGYFDNKEFGFEVPPSVTVGKEEYEKKVNPLYEFVESEIIFEDGNKTDRQIETPLEELWEHYLQVEGKGGRGAINTKKAFNKQFKVIAELESKSRGFSIKMVRGRYGMNWINVDYQGRHGDDDYLEFDPAETTKVCRNTDKLGNPNSMSIIEYIKDLSGRGQLPSLVRTSPIHSEVPEVDVPLFPFTEEGELDGGETVCDEQIVKAEPEEVIEETKPKQKYKFIPEQVAVAIEIHDILREFSNATSGRQHYGYDNLKGAVCEQLRIHNPSWSDIDLESIYDKLAEDDPKIAQYVIEITRGG